jgi:hypothetical protein
MIYAPGISLDPGRSVPSGETRLNRINENDSAAVLNTRRGPRPYYEQHNTNKIALH